MTKATARANANIAFIKYWGNRDHDLRLPVNSSLSMNLDGMYTETTVYWEDALSVDELILNGQPASPPALDRVSKHLDHLRSRLGEKRSARVESSNNFPTGAGIASSASAFAALTMAAVAASGEKFDEKELTTLARLGSGSASRSIPTGFVKWYAADNHADSFAESIASPSHWDLIDVVAIISKDHKATTSQAGHVTADTSDLQRARVAGASARLRKCEEAILSQDFSGFAEVVELDSNLMHAVMMTSQPALFYWLPDTLAVMESVRQWRQQGLSVCYTLDAGPNVHCICLSRDADEVRNRLQNLSGIQDIRTASPGEGAVVVTTS